MSGRSLWAKGLLLAVLATAAVARAAKAETPASPQPDGAWYGYQTLASDLAAFALITSGAVLGSNMDSAALGLGLAIPGGALYFAGGPLIRAGHGDGAGARNSLLRRVLIPISAGALAAGIAALAAPSGSSDICNDQRACYAAAFGTLGFGAGMIAASVVDAITAREAAAAPSASAGGAAQVPLPGFVISRKGAAFGLRLAF
jgi:hypothetical protein